MVKCAYLKVNTPDVKEKVADVMVNAYVREHARCAGEPISKQAKRDQLTPLNCVYLSINFAM